LLYLSRHNSILQQKPKVGYCQLSVFSSG